MVAPASKHRHFLYSPPTKHKEVIGCFTRPNGEINNQTKRNGRLAKQNWPIENSEKNNCAKLRIESEFSLGVIHGPPTGALGCAGWAGGYLNARRVTHKSKQTNARRRHFGCFRVIGRQSRGSLLRSFPLVVGNPEAQITPHPCPEPLCTHLLRVFLFMVFRPKTAAWLCDRERSQQTHFTRQVMAQNHPASFIFCFR